MKKKLDKTTVEFEMMQEFWSIWQEYYIPEDSDEYWDSLTKRADQYEKKYDGDTAVYLMLAVLKDIENRYNTRK